LAGGSGPRVVSSPLGHQHNTRLDEVQAIEGDLGEMAAMTLSAVSRSAAKWFLPPSQ
jgi:hypothetical protein